MSDKITLAEALVRAQERAASSNDTPPRQLPENTALELLRTAALIHGFDPDGVERSFLEGGPLAELVRAVLNAEPVVKPPRGRPPNLEESWNTYTGVVQLTRLGHSVEDAIGFLSNALKVKESKIRSQYQRTRDDPRVDPSHVPSAGLASLFTASLMDPRPRPKPASERPRVPRKKIS
ncbi:hypothetical protein FV222_06815 [Methylobacterium sp. WL103]|uniref:hypothetical protein n=1 Tax=Methylobacterium sp. WL103 TaxID=2603891 RepID=UPI0011CA885B|nr:hypothetical protein [Methylobacterium sp. WL103]TXN05322.1 hypothetical protein FV222_06815 [Methylobacterium sp. WL103]